MHPEESMPGPSGSASAAQRRRIILSDSEDDTPSQQSSDDGSNSDSSSSGNGIGRPQCCICLNRLSRHEVGSPELCDHLFCIICLQSWAEGKPEATCPIDRHPFTLIKIRRIESSTVLRTVPVTTVKKTSADQELDNFLNFTSEDDFNTYCEVCRECDREAAMLLCDSCDCGYHMDCLQPALEVVPIEEWFCPTCSIIVDTTSSQASSEQSSRSRNGNRRARSTSASQSRQRGRRSGHEEVRVLPRTREVERVRKRVRKIRETKASRGRGQRAADRKKSKKNLDATEMDASEMRDKFNASIIPSLSMVGDDDDFDASHNEDPLADEFLKRFGKDESRLSVSTAAKIFHGALSVPRPTYCGRSKIEERVETCPGSASISLLDVLLDSQSTLLNKQIDITEERKVVARGKKRELANSDDESLRCMKKPLPSVLSEAEQQQQKEEKQRKKDEERLKVPTENGEKEVLGGKERVEAPKVSDLKVEERSSLDNHRHHRDDRESRSSDHYGYRKKDHYRHHDSYSRSKNGHHGYSSGYRSDRRSPYNRRDSRKHDSRHEAIRCDEKSGCDSKERDGSRHNRHDRHSDTKHRSKRGDGDRKRHAIKSWGFGGFRHSSSTSADDRPKSDAVRSQAPPTPAPEEKETKIHSEHTMTLPKAFQSFGVIKTVKNANEGTQGVARAERESKQENGKASKIIELFGDDNDLSDENETDNPFQSTSSPPDSKEYRKTNDVSLIKSCKEKSPVSCSRLASSLLDSDRERSLNDNESACSRSDKLKNDLPIASSNNGPTNVLQSRLNDAPSRALDTGDVVSLTLLDLPNKQTLVSPTASISSPESSGLSCILPTNIPSTLDSRNSLSKQDPPTSVKNGRQEDACSPTVNVLEGVRPEESSNKSDDAASNLSSASEMNPRDAARLKRSGLENVPAVSMPVFTCVKKGLPSLETSNLNCGNESKNEEKLLDDSKAGLGGGGTSNSANDTSPPVMRAGFVLLDKVSVAAVVKKRLDPVFQAKEISKQSYKDIVFKCVHKIIEKDTGTQILASKIIALVERYLEFYQHKEKKDKKVTDSKE